MFIIQYFQKDQNKKFIQINCITVCDDQITVCDDQAHNRLAILFKDFMDWIISAISELRHLELIHIEKKSNEWTNRQMD